MIDQYNGGNMNLDVNPSNLIVNSKKNLKRRELAPLNHNHPSPGQMWRLQWILQ